WWVGARMLEERELACDEGVLSLGSEPRIYAEAILSVCKLFVESPLACVAGISGADLKKRIHTILDARVPGELTAIKKAALAFAGMFIVALPLAVGIISASNLQGQVAASKPKFEVASIKPCSADAPGGRSAKGGGDASPGTLNVSCLPVSRIIED